MKSVLSRLGRAGLGAGVALIMVAVLARPAAAGTAYSTSDGVSGVFASGATSDGHDVQLNGEFAGVNSGSTLVEFFWCVVSATPDAKDIALPTCSLQGVPATVQVPVQPIPGAVTVAIGVARFDLGSIPGGLTLCGAGVADFAEAIAGAPQVGVSACTPAPTATPSVPDVNTVIDDLDTVANGEVAALMRTEECLTFQTCVGPDL